MKISRRPKLVSEYGQCFKWYDSSGDIPIAGIQSGLYKSPVYDLSPHMQHKRTAPNTCVSALNDRNAECIFDQYDIDEEERSNGSVVMSKDSIKFSKSKNDSNCNPHSFRMTSQASSEYRSSYIPPNAEWRQVRSAGLPSRSASCKTVRDRVPPQNSVPKLVNMQRQMYSSYDLHKVGQQLNAWSTEYKRAFVVPERCEIKPAGLTTPLREKTNQSIPANLRNISNFSSMHDYKVDDEQQLPASTCDKNILLDQPTSNRSNAKISPRQKNIGKVSPDYKSDREKLSIESCDFVENDAKESPIDTEKFRNHQWLRLQNDDVPLREKHGHHSKLVAKKKEFSDKGRRVSRDNQKLKQPQPCKLDNGLSHGETVGFNSKISPNNNKAVCSSRSQRSLARQYQRRSWNTHLWWWVDGGGPVLKEESVSGHTTPRYLEGKIIEDKTSSRKTYTKGLLTSDRHGSDYESSDRTITPPPSKNSKSDSHCQAVATQFPLNNSPEYVYEGGDLKDYQFRPIKSKRIESARSNQAASTQRSSSTKGTYRLPEKDCLAASGPF